MLQSIDYIVRRAYFDMVIFDVRKCFGKSLYILGDWLIRATYLMYHLGTGLSVLQLTKYMTLTCSLTRELYRPSNAINSSCVPFSTTSPSLTATMISAFLMVDKR